MTRKDYYLIIKVLKDLPRIYGNVPYDALVGAMAKEFELDSKRFNRTAFVTACYPDARLDTMMDQLADLRKQLEERSV